MSNRCLSLNNPLLENNRLPPFDRITPDMIQPAIEKILEDNRSLIEQLVQQDNPGWHNLMDQLALMDDRLNKAWSPVRHLNSVKSSDELREAHDRCVSLLSEYSTEISQNRALYDRVKQIRDSAEFGKLDVARQKAITDSLRNFRLGGVGLEGEARNRYQQLQRELSELESDFENNLLDAAQSWEMLIEEKSALQGLPEYALAMMRQLAAQKDYTGYRVTLDMPCFIAVITHADNRELRKAIYQAYTTRASDQGFTDKKWDNAAIMADIVSKKQEKAKLLGFQSYAEYSLETKMAESVDGVINFLEELAQCAREAAIKEVEDRQQFAESLGFEGEVQAWDAPYYSEKLKQQRFNISDEELKPYFSDNTVIVGLFEIVKKLYGIEIEKIESGIAVWHPTVRFFQIRDSQGDIIGQFYLDLYAREKKRGGAWMDECVSRHKINRDLQIPVAYLTCNLTPPIGDKPALFTHDEVLTLFHEFGHGLHHMLTRIDVPDVAGINGVEWDAVELPSQFMENYCWEKEALQMFARHYETGEVLQMLRQVEFSLFDMRLHQETEIDSADKIQQILDEVRSQVSVVSTPPENRFQNGFSHIFAGGYGAGYYSYKWAEVLSSDAFSAFEEEGIFNPDTGRRFLDCILQVGGSRPALESFRCFRGREPKNEALLRHSGITS